MLHNYRLTLTPQGQEPEVVELKDTSISYNYIYQVNSKVDTRNSLNLVVSDLEDSVSTNELFDILHKLEENSNNLTVKFENQIDEDTFVKVCEGTLFYAQIAVNNFDNNDNSLNLTIEFQVGE